jgi:hypothetical protein
MRETNAGKLFYGTMLVIENLQIMYFMMHQQFNFLWPTKLTEVMQYGII